ncbi:MAG: hypothetical protein DRP64_08955 [Verrucomicrobia bacterium]|nr:MAG: hypothetical protein DRP64_08955 [Verrucomicrobiota bacterium]RLA43839.1 MAG: hypothetical protein DRQ97_12230 [Gammaproteobacteria bacterium]
MHHITSIARAIDIEGALLIFAVLGAALIGLTIEWRVALLVLVIASAITGIFLVRSPSAD